MSRYLLLLLFTWASWSLGQTAQPETPAPAPTPSRWEEIKTKTEEKAKDAYDAGVDAAKTVHGSLSQSRQQRALRSWTLLGDYSLFETWVLNKKGITLGYNTDEDHTYEFEYMTGSFGWSYFGVDIGEIKEQKFALLARTYGGRGTFNFITGIYLNKMSIQLGTDLLKTLAPDAQTSVKFLELGTAGITWGLGNRWQLRNGFNVGADWVVLNIPLMVTQEETPFLSASQSESNRKDVETALKILKRFPAFAVIKIQVGASF